MTLTQAQSGDHLQPTEDYFTSTNANYTALSKLREVLYTGLSDKPLARIVMLPPTSPGYLLSIEHDGPNYYLTYRVGQQGVWYMLHARSKQDVAVETKIAEVSQELALALANLFAKAVSQTAYPKLNNMTTDAGHLIVVAHQPGIGLRSGSALAIGNGSNITALITIIERARALAITPTDQLLQTALIQEANKLFARFED